MKMIIKEFEGVKKRVAGEKFATLRNEKILTLTKQVDWLQTEALHYRQAEREVHDKYDGMKGKNEALKDDSYFLRRALLNSKVK